MVSLVAVVLSLLAINAGSMKTHQTGNQTFDLSKIKSQTCAEVRRAAVNNMIDDLERSNGFDAVFYRGCVKFVAANADGKHAAAAQTEKLGQACKKGMFDGHNSVLTKVDPSKLAEECDRAVYQMDMQLKILGPDSFQTSKDFCAVFVDLVLPIDEEPDCMRFVEDITHAHYDFAGTMHHWPRITKEKHFDEAFMRVCLEDKKLEMEEKGYEVVWGSGSDECRLVLERIMAAKWIHYKKLSEFFAYACPVMGKPLPQPSDKSFDPATATKRSMATQLFHRASHIAHSAANYSNATVQLVEPRRKKFSAMQLMDDALDESVSAKSPRRRRLTTNERVCCSGKAYNWELGVAAGSSSITVSASVSLAAGGFSAWEDKTCIFEKSNVHEVCLNWDFGVDMDGPLELDVSIARGWFKSYGDMLGRSTFVGANACFILCVGGSVIQAMNGDVIGGTVEFGFGFPGVDFEGGICQCTRNSGYQKLRFHGLKDRCPSGCFPEDAMVQTAQGSKNMSDLRVGDHVLTVNSAGDLVFEEIYFFGHADPKAFSPMVQLLIQAFRTQTQMLQ